MYLTRWAKLKKDGTIQRGEYRTKEKTPYHDSIHETCDYAFSGPEKGILHFMERMTKTPKWKGYMERREEERKGKEKARQRLRDAAPDLLAALKGMMDDVRAGRPVRASAAEAAIAKAEEVKP